ncbi:hypothetical protein Acor_46440 [Acrocarpospora corrugata]|uniref:Histidine kinase/HSP90-like ATPase domain-containing protein n=1 Tax=Acrocarpospora corrugata TaxID=35763 RepID=A0A5M3W7T0_9ACTN|nr:hypothetical protein [Acrocarpospora corrugata]GES02578.1 hypothetical protein Acor_46440 [Acrocarpospora corrugata]
MTILNRAERTVISRPYFGDAAEAGAARRFISRCLGAAHPCRDDAVQLAGELISESLRHTITCGDLAGYTIAVTTTADTARVVLSAQSRCPCWTRPALGRGVHLVSQFTPLWGALSTDHGTTVWFEVARSAHAPRRSRPSRSDDGAHAGP